MPMYLYLSDVTRIETDVIVNAADTDLWRCPGIYDATFAVVNTEKLERVCQKLGRCRIGQTAVTSDCGLPCRYIIHVAEPGWYGGESRERFLLTGRYQNALYKAYLYSCRRVTVPLILSGNYHMPRTVPLRVVGAAIVDFCQHHPSVEVTLVLYRQSIYDMARHILGWGDAPS